MLRLYVWLRDLLRREDGQDLVEYALIAALFGAIIVGTVTVFISGAFDTWATNVRDCISDPNSSQCPW